MFLPVSALVPHLPLLPGAAPSHVPFLLRFPIHASPCLLYAGPHLLLSPSPRCLHDCRLGPLNVDRVPPTLLSRPASSCLLCTLCRLHPSLDTCTSSTSHPHAHLFIGCMVFRVLSWAYQ
ncbi:hypothetical protein FKP32DRAFT_710267 [Trametes sanguinea]|nr:hypothetical protein FKP32DRAFT_710267 [Trametes sanguinea]